MEQLPDDALVALMQYLALDDLFTCRLVCRRLGAMAVQPGVWRGRSLRCYSTPPPPGMCPVLRVAPCLNHLDILVSSGEVSQCCQLMLAATRCAVRSIRVSVKVKERGAVAQAALLIRRQEALGRLRVVAIALYAQDGDDASVLLATIASMPDLARLEVVGIRACKSNLVSHFFTSSSLKYFKCKLRPESASFCTFMIAANDNALQEVDLVGDGKDFKLCSTLTSVAPLLAGLPHLRKLRCRMLPGLEAVADSESLRELSLAVLPEDQPAERGAAALLSRALRLRAVTLIYQTAARDVTDVGVSLVLALAASGQSAVESLTIRNGGLDEDLPQAQPLLAALPFLPALRHLEVSVPPDALLLGISPASAPALQTLTVHNPKWELLQKLCVYCEHGSVICLHHACAHFWLHIDAVNTLLSVNPSLQLIVPRGGGFYCGRNCCSACQEGCHLKLRDCRSDRNLELNKMMLLPRNIPR